MAAENLCDLATDDVDPAAGARSVVIGAADVAVFAVQLDHRVEGCAGSVDDLAGLCPTSEVHGFGDGDKAERPVLCAVLSETVCSWCDRPRAAAVDVAVAAGTGARRGDLVVSLGQFADQQEHLVIVLGAPRFDDDEDGVRFRGLGGVHTARWY